MLSGQERIKSRVSLAFQLVEAKRWEICRRHYWATVVVVVVMMVMMRWGRGWREGGRQHVGRSRRNSMLRASILRRRDIVTVLMRALVTVVVMMIVVVVWGRWVGPR